MSGFSVVVPCYNGASFLSETLCSVLTQTVTPREVVFVDDGSTDDSAAVAESFADRLRTAGIDLRVVRQENRGESVARNRGVDLAVGEWVAFLDADDVWEPTRLAAVGKVAAAAGPRVTCIFNGHYIFDGAGRRPDPPERTDFPTGKGVSADLRSMLVNGGVLPSAAAVRRSVAAAVRFPEEVRENEDLLFLLDVRRHGDFVRVPGRLTGWRRGPSQQSGGARHRLLGALNRLAWLAAHGDALTGEDQAAVRRGLVARLVSAHELAYWERDWKTVQACRRAAADRFDLPPAAHPPQLTRRLPPVTVVAAKDAAGHVLAAVRRALIPVTKSAP
ncbi:glycosyltransferase family 2 protein [Alienimonas californiensis]|uniref:Glycosyltransferase EpsH n=1 Tax=Alienimonas californiensis TaxID=2527989 RepID=A0A517P482_9PLAN|nr:glycosyltransferase family A protein [Alienimonas californiensis]QDT14179.1 Putative glycosyltransferase EpsH [Alienimonas californiensis]